MDKDNMSAEPSPPPQPKRFTESNMQKTGAIKKSKTKSKTPRKYQDFYKKSDLQDPDIHPHYNLTIVDFDAEGHIVNPRAPCVVTTIDPSYIEDAKAQRIPKKFRVKTDILRLREITRKKFYIYSTQERCLEKQRETEYQDHVFKRSMDFHEFSEDCLKKMEAEAFNEMVKANDELKTLQANKVDEELEIVAERHQRELMQVQDIYQRFQFLLKLIGYFDDIAEESDDGESIITLTKPPEITELCITERTPIRAEHIELLKSYMARVVRPYLAKRRHLNADVWLKGYELTRQKIFHFNRRLMHMALLNHIVTIVHEKFQKSYAQRTMKPIYLNDPKSMEKRVEALKTRAKDILTNYETEHKQDKLTLTLNAIVPVILHSIEIVLGKKKNGHELQPLKQQQHSSVVVKRAVKSSAEKTTKKPASAVAGSKSKAAATTIEKSEQHTDTMLTKVEQIQMYLMDLLNELDAMPPAFVKMTERRVRRQVHAAKEMSRRALVKQNRLNNWMEHFKKHELAKRDYH